MNNLKEAHYIGAVFILVLISVVGLLSGRKVKSANDFSVGGHQVGFSVVVGSIIGTLVGGSATIGTAQLAYSYGFSAWWFTLGGGLGCLILALGFAKPVYESGVTTMPQLFAKEYNRRVATLVTVLTSLGSILNVVSQILSGIVLIGSVTSFGTTASSVIVVVLIMCYVLFGGVWGVGIVGMVKTILLCLTMGTCALLVVGEGFSAITLLPSKQYFNLVARGVSVDVGAGLSLVIGLLSTQAYVQAIISARSLKIAKAGVLTGAALIPMLGLMGILVGLYMRVYSPDINAAMALPLFIFDKLPPLVGGAMLSTLLVALVGTGAGVILGISAMISTDIYKEYINPKASAERTLWVVRGIIVGLLIVAGLLANGNASSLILDWSYLSMGLRGSVAFGVLVAAVFLPGKIPAKYAEISVIVGPTFLILGCFILPAGINPIFLGVTASLVVLIVCGAICGGGSWVGRTANMHGKKKL